jgi:hypothetical protein
VNAPYLAQRAEFTKEFANSPDRSIRFSSPKSPTKLIIYFGTYDRSPANMPVRGSTEKL